MTAPVRVAVCADFAEECWPSMDRVASMLLDELGRHHADTIAVSPVRPPFRRRATRVWSARPAFTFDRFANRLWDYPRTVGAIAGDYDVVHVVDHSYSQLVHRVPEGRAVVTCHDLDTFRSVLDPDLEPRSAPFRAMARHILTGLRRAAVVTCDTSAIRDEIVARGLVPGERLVVAPMGVGRAYSSEPDAAADRAAARLVASPDDAIELLHVGSTIPRKRIDLLLRVFASLRRERAGLRLVRVGGPFTREQDDLVDALGVRDAIVVLGFVDDRTLAAIYRRAALVLQPSDREGFGLPLVEAMACGTPVVASDLPVLREVGGAAAEYCPPGDEGAWRQAVAALLEERARRPERLVVRAEAARARARLFGWDRFAARLADVYLDVAGRRHPALARSSA